MKRGLNLGFNNNPVELNNLSSFLTNVLISGIDILFFSLRYNDTFLILLNPKEDFNFVIFSVTGYLNSLGLKNFVNKLHFFNVFNGFDFLGYNFKYFWSKNLYLSPSNLNYRVFLKRVKSIVNNSNYGAFLF